MDTYHTSVLLHEAISLLDIRSGKKYIDATLGGGGHSFEILKRGGIVLGLDMDEDAIWYVEEKVKSQKSKVKIGNELVLVRGNFREIDSIARENDFTKVAGVLFDLGVSSHHFDAAERGFSLQKDAPLDMRMDRNLSVKASDLVNGLTKGELYELFNKFGEERFAHSISDSIVSSRKVKPIQTTIELAGIVERAIKRKRSEVHPATKVFQALRIAVNDELNNLREALPKALELLEKNGRLVVISFHSLEDRIVKNQFKLWGDEGKGKIITEKPVTASEEEVERNNRSRSAKLRVFEKL